MKTIFAEAVLVWALCAGMLHAGEWRILKPTSAPEAYTIAANEFQKYYGAVTGTRLDIVTEPGPAGNVVVIGSDSVNGFCRTAVEQKIISPLGVGADIDGYRIKSAEKDGRCYLFLAGGNGRSTLYAVYDFFERQAGCHYFWDGDVIPKMSEIKMDGLDVSEVPRFAYRGLRYFAHRSLNRFQAEHWGPAQWEKEIDWILKKRLNLFMLRIGMDDVYQKAFPDLVPYPPTNAPLPEAVTRSYDDRTSAWPLQYRGELRKHILQYARARGLVHPEDTGTMTHWYSRTPKAFLEKIKPSFTPQASHGYGEDTGLVWDIRNDQNIDNYWKLTQAHINAYGKPDMFHTIGLAERNVFTNRADNLEMKLFAYRRIIEKLREHHQQAPMLIASWDFYWPGWTGEEVSNLLKLMDPQNTFIFDYTSDLPTGKHNSNFQDWGVVGKFPWFFGIFHAFESENELRGNYDLIRERMPVAAADPMCKGFVYWPENSHSDNLILEFFTRNAWKPDTLTPESLLPSFCRDRYQAASAPMLAAWQAALPLIRMHSELPLMFNRLASIAQRTVTSKRTEGLRGTCAKLEPNMKEAPSICRLIAALPYGAGNALVDRDAIDLARTMTGRIFAYAIYRYELLQGEWMQGKADAAAVQAAGQRVTAILTALRDILALHEDYSMNASMKKLQAIHAVNPCFEQALKGNAENGYCRTYIYELFNDYYLQQLKLYTEWVSEHVTAGDTKKPMKPAKPLPMKEIVDAFYSKPLVEMAPPTVTNPAENYRTILNHLASVCEKL
ncbi:MAG: alpha-N-acetylglucosaminidase TIM-barrel domain-containing protein [Kiritimatiellae bacterium]|nr:alpha-N-acetylglucosaminidase TIM-barrel domain-containing protein [Kiritimatiellia bacterium]MDD5523143.1 alpha-N-acetylglucosaminidase TIM-barrel domain-containing protein [Kiritimatiellia bacterium]